MITEAFRKAAAIRAKVLGFPDHPVVVLEHPIANRTEVEMSDMAERAIDLVASGLVAKR